MKHYISLFAILVATTLTVGCSLDKKSPSDYDEEVVYSNETLTRYSLNAVYDAYAQMASYRTDLPYYYGCNTDVERRAYSDNEKNNTGKYVMSPSWGTWNNTATTYLFAGNFLGIEQDNLIIAGLKKYGDIDKRPEMGALYGEALTARALLYTTLLNVYGEVPARFEPVTEETIYLPKADKDVLYKQLINDLEEAASYMKFDKNQLTISPSKACAEALYARLVLYACGYSLRPDEGKVNTGDKGTVRKSTDPFFNPSVLYPKALVMLDDVIKNSGIKLAGDYLQYWKDVCDQKNVTYGNETIFALPFSSQRGQWMIANAVPNSKHNFGSGGGNHLLSPTLFFRYDPEDIRRDITCCPVKYDDNGKASIAGMNTWYFGKFHFEWMVDHPLPKKGGECGVKVVYIRLADVYLMAAEMANELGKLPEAKEYMRPILNRAFAGNTTKVDAYLDALTNKEQFFQAVKDQRMFEFAGELLRRMDLIRWGELKKALDEDKTRMQNLKNRTGEYEGKFNNEIYYRYLADGLNMEFYGLNPGETAKPASGWTKKSSYFSGMNDAMFNDLYRENPDEKMWRPIPQSIINASNGALQNDYGYTNN